MTDDILRRQTVLPAAPAAAASLLEPVLAEVAGAGADEGRSAHGRTGADDAGRA